MSKRFRSTAPRSAAQPTADALAGKRLSYQSGRAMRYVVRPVLMALLITAGMAGVVSILAAVSGDVRWSAMTLLIFLVALEGIYTTNWLQQPLQLPLDRAAYRAAELALLIAGIRLATWVVFADGWPTRDILVEYLLNPGPLFLDPPFLIATAVTVVVWRLGALLSGLFHELEVSEFELRYYSLPLAQRKAQADDQPIRRGRSESVHLFTRLWLWGGMFLAVTVGISRLDAESLRATFLAPLATGRAALEPGYLAALLAYFLVGLWLISQARLMEMDARWLLNGVSKDPQMRLTWQRTSLFILIGLALVAAFLPIGSTSALSQLVSLLIYGLLFLANILIFVLTLPFALILALISGDSEAAPLPPPPSARTLFEQRQQEIQPISETVTMILSSAFWTLLIAGLAVALLYFLRERRRRAEGEEVGQMWQQFLAWLTAVWARWRGRLPTFDLPRTATSPEGDTGPDTLLTRLRRRLHRMSGLSPREQVRAFYLMAVRRAQEEGVPRQPPETPLEFVQDLREKWPAAEDDLQELTDAFLKARYSEEPIAAEDLPHVKQSWQSLRKEMGRSRAERRDGQDGSGTAAE